MDEIFDYIGEGLLAIAGAILFYALYRTYYDEGGAIYDALVSFMGEICGI
jgi:hypothetical protein